MICTDHLRGTASIALCEGCSPSRADDRRPLGAECADREDALARVSRRAVGGTRRRGLRQDAAMLARILNDFNCLHDTGQVDESIIIRRLMLGEL